MVGTLDLLVSFWDGLFSGAMLVLGRVYIYIYLQCGEVQARLAELCGMASTFASLVMVLWAACMPNVGSTSDGNCTEENMLLQMEERHHVSHMRQRSSVMKSPSSVNPT